MTNVFRRILVHGAPHKASLCAALLTALLASSALAQDTAEPETAFDRQLGSPRPSSVLGAFGQFSTSSNGTNYARTSRFDQ